MNSVTIRPAASAELSKAPWESTMVSGLSQSSEKAIAPAGGSIATRASATTAKMASATSSSTSRTSCVLADSSMPR